MEWILTDAIGSVFCATSLDGFIAREDGGIDWLSALDEQGVDAYAQDHGFEAFMSSVDALVMGRNTFELVLSLGMWPYGAKPVVVLTTRPIDPSVVPAPTVEFMSGSPQEIVARLGARGMRNLYIDGGVTIQRFLAAGLIRRLIITRVPVILGRGIPLFGDAGRDIALRHVETRSFPNGLVQSEYEVVR